MHSFSKESKVTEKSKLYAIGLLPESLTIVYDTQSISADLQDHVAGSRTPDTPTLGCPKLSGESVTIIPLPNQSFAWRGADLLLRDHSPISNSYFLSIVLFLFQ